MWADICTSSELARPEMATSKFAPAWYSKQVIRRVSMPPVTSALTLSPANERASGPKCATTL